MPPCSASGFLCFGPSTFAGMALILSIFANSRCYLVKPNVFQNDVNNFFPTAPESIGLWCYTTNNGSLYDASGIQGDSKYQAARGLGVTVMCLGWTILIFYCIAGCKRFPGTVFKFIGLLGLLCGLFQGLVFLVYKSEICSAGCVLDTGGKCGIAACVFWFMTGLMSMAAGKEVDGDDNGDRGTGDGDGEEK